jgi:hypothetical protein
MNLSRVRLFSLRFLCVLCVSAVRGLNFTIKNKSPELDA